MADMPPDAPEFLTVKELAVLLRLKERKVYDLAAKGEVPCSRATGKLLFPNAEIRTWLAASRSGSLPDLPAAPAAPLPPRPNIVLGSHDPLLDWAIRESRCGLATYFDGSLDGLRRFHKREGIAAGTHIYDTATGAWNVPRVAVALEHQPVVLVGFVTRQRGLVVAQAPSAPASLADLVGRRVTPRQPEAGSHGLFQHLLAQASIPPDALHLTDEARSELDAVQAVARGEADATLGLQSLAHDYGLGFVPLIEERFDLIVDRRAWFEEPWQQLMTFCHGPRFAAQQARMPGYDASPLGQVRWNG